MGLYLYMKIHGEMDKINPPKLRKFVLQIKNWFNSENADFAKIGKMPHLYLSGGCKFCEIIYGFSRWIGYLETHYTF